MICPECQTEAAPGAKFCRNCGEQLPDATTPETVETAVRTASLPSASAQTVASPAVPPPKPTPDALPTVVGQAVTATKPPEAFKTVAAAAVPPPKPPEAFKTVVSSAVSQAAGAASVNPQPVVEQTVGERGGAADDRSGNRFIRIILVLAALGFLAGLAIFFVVYGLGEKPRPATNRVGVEILDGAITRIELCAFKDKPNNPNAFDERTIAGEFPAGVGFVALRLTGALKPHSECRVVWRQAASPTPLLAQAVPSMSGNQPIVRLFYQPDGKPLPTGSYVVEVQDGDRPLARAYFTIGMQNNPR